MALKIKINYNKFFIILLVNKKIYNNNYSDIILKICSFKAKL